MIVIWGAFKVGSTTIYNTIVKNSPELEIFKTHTDVGYLDRTSNIDYVVIPIRRDRYEQYMSAYFSDIIDPLYEYSPFNRFLHNFKNLDEMKKINLIQIIDVKLLINDFKSVKWEQYEWLNVEIALSLLHNTFDFTVDLNSINDILIINAIRKKDNRLIKLCFIITEKINKNTIMKIYDELNINYDPNTFELVDSNIGVDKWYGDKYKEFKQLIKFNNVTRTV